VAKDESFDVVSQVDMQEVDNAVGQAARELTTRYDLKDSGSSVTLDKSGGTVTIAAPSDFVAKQVRDILESKLVKRSIDLMALSWGAAEAASGGTVRVTARVVNGIEADIAAAGINYSFGEKRRSEPRFGRYHYFLPAGPRQVTFTAAGYPPRTFDVNITAGKAVLLEAQLGDGARLTVNGTAAQDGVLDLDFDYPAGAGKYYLNGISLGNTGFTFKNGVHVPLDLDALYMASVGVLPGWAGYLNGAGHADSSLPIPRDSSVAGLTIYMGYFVYDMATHQAVAASPAVDITIDY